MRRPYLAALIAVNVAIGIWFIMDDKRIGAINLAAAAFVAYLNRDAE